MTQEIEIHRGLLQPCIVRLHDFFEDADNVYILLELCSRRSLMELSQRRKTVTEPEARYFTKQVVSACEYLHGRAIIHRDLKLGNLFLNDEMRVKVGDFGLATTVDCIGERKKTLCGTPNYIAPEVLNKKGHSFEVDIWAVGCILYTLLVGKPPFETLSLKETYQRIKDNEYVIPPRISPDATHLIRCLLASSPSKRPTIYQVARFDFFLKGFLPPRLPTSCLTTEPKFTQAQLSGIWNNERLILGECRRPCAVDGRLPEQDNVSTAAPPLAPVPEVQMLVAGTNGDQADKDNMNEIPSDYYLAELLQQLIKLIEKKPSERNLVQEACLDEAEDPSAIPVYWISKWVDYSDKYGLSYQLCDNSLGVLFNDNTKLVISADGEQVQYTERDNSEEYFAVSASPPELQKKMTLLKYFREYMQKRLQTAGANIERREGDELARLPYLRTWLRTGSAIIFHLSNGTLQINFFQDHTKLILCPLLSAATYIDQKLRFRTLKFDLLKKFGCSKDLFSRLKYALSMVERLVTQPRSNTNIAANTQSSSQGASQ